MKYVCLYFSELLLNNILNKTFSHLEETRSAPVKIRITNGLPHNEYGQTVNVCVDETNNTFSNFIGLRFAVMDSIKEYLEKHHIQLNPFTHHIEFKWIDVTITYHEEKTFSVSITKMEYKIKKAPYNYEMSF